MKASSGGIGLTRLRGGDKGINTAAPGRSALVGFFFTALTLWVYSELLCWVFSAFCLLPAGRTQFSCSGRTLFPAYSLPGILGFLNRAFSVFLLRAIPLGILSRFSLSVLIFRAVNMFLFQEAALIIFESTTTSSNNQSRSHLLDSFQEIPNLRIL